MISYMIFFIIAFYIFNQKKLFLKARLHPIKFSTKIDYRNVLT